MMKLVLLFLLSVVPCLAFIYLMAYHPELPPLNWFRRRKTALGRDVTALLVWPLLGFVLYLVGQGLVWIGHVMMLPVGVLAHMFFSIWKQMT